MTHLSSSPIPIAGAPSTGAWPPVIFPPRAPICPALVCPCIACWPAAPCCGRDCSISLAPGAPTFSALPAATATCCPCCSTVKVPRVMTLKRGDWVSWTSASSRASDMHCGIGLGWPRIICRTSARFRKATSCSPKTYSRSSARSSTGFVPSSAARRLMAW